MKKNLMFLGLLLFCSNLVTSQELKAYEKKAKAFIENVRNGRKDNIAATITYPFEREYPIPSIKNKAEFVKRYDEVFDEILKAEIIKSLPQKDWKDMGWRGIELNNGNVWIDKSGALITVNYQSKFETRLKNKLIEAERFHLHASLTKYKAPLYLLETLNYRVRIDDMGNGNYRYASWPIKQKMSDAPEVVILEGTWIHDNNSKNHHFEFTKKGGFVYDCSIIEWGEPGSPPAKVMIYQNNKEVFSEAAKIVVK